MDGELEESEGAAAGDLGADAGRAARRRALRGERRRAKREAKASARRKPGPKPAREPDGRVVTGTLRHVLKSVSRSVNRIARREFAKIGGRWEELCYFRPETLAWTVVLSAVVRNGSSLQADTCRNDPAYVRSLSELSGQDGLEFVPCMETVRLWLADLPGRGLEDLLVEMFRRLVRSKRLGGWKFGAHFAMALDASQRERCRAGTTSNGKSWRNELVLSLVSPWGKLPVMREPVDQWATEVEKRDCELAAAKRLLPRFRRKFPNLAVCLLADGLYACEPMFDVCDGGGNSWRFVFTFKEGCAKSVYAEAMSLMSHWSPYDVPPDGAHRRAAHKTAEGMVGWSADVPWGDSGRRVCVVRCVEESPQKYDGAFVTNIPVDGARSASDVATWGRRRWQIESQFHGMKHGCCTMGHNYCNIPRGGGMMFVLRLYAYALASCFVAWHVPRLTEGCRKVTQLMLARLVWAQLHADGFPPEDVGYRNARLDI